MSKRKNMSERRKVSLDEITDKYYSLALKSLNRKDKSFSRVFCNGVKDMLSTPGDLRCFYSPFYGCSAIILLLTYILSFQGYFVYPQQELEFSFLE